MCYKQSQACYLWGKIGRIEGNVLHNFGILPNYRFRTERWCLPLAISDTNLTYEVVSCSIGNSRAVMGTSTAAQLIQNDK